MNKTTVKTLTEQQIDALCQEAAQAGDRETIDLCQLVLNREGSRDQRDAARAEIARIIADNEVEAAGYHTF